MIYSSSNPFNPKSLARFGTTQSIHQPPSPIPRVAPLLLPSPSLSPSLSNQPRLIKKGNPYLEKYEESPVYPHTPTVSSPAAQQARTRAQRLQARCCRRWRGTRGRRSACSGLGSTRRGGRTWWWWLFFGFVLLVGWIDGCWGELDIWEPRVADQAGEVVTWGWDGWGVT